MLLEFCIYEKYIGANALKKVHMCMHGYGREAAECFFCTMVVNGLTHYTRECKNAILRVTTIMLHLCNKFTARLLENKVSYK